MRLRSGKITIENTNKCPAKCVICPRDKYKQRPLGEMDFNLYAKIINNLSQQTNVDTVDIGGFGEPFADNLLFDRCREIRKKLPNVKIFTSSNCFLMKPSIHDEVVKYIDALKISVYGVSPEVYHASHGTLTIKQTYDNILTLLERRTKPYTIGLLTLSPENEHEKDAWIQFWQPRLDEVYVWRPHNFAGLMKFREIDRTRQISCGRPFNGPLYVHLDGKVSMCCLDINKQLLIGDLNYQTIPEVFHSKEYRRIRRAHKERNFKGLLCYNCCQTNYNPDVLVYASDDKRAVGKLNSNLKELYEK